APGHAGPEQLPVTLRDRVRGAERRLEAAHVLVQIPDAFAVAALRRREPELMLVVAEHEVRLHQVRVEGVARYLREVVLHDTDRLAQRLDDAELAIRVVVGPQRRAPEEEGVRTPGEAAAQLAVRDRG